MNSKTKSSGYLNVTLLTPFRIMPATICVTPIIMLIFILNEFRKASSLDARFHTGSMPELFNFTKGVDAVLVLDNLQVGRVHFVEVVTTAEEVEL